MADGMQDGDGSVFAAFQLRGEVVFAFEVGWDLAFAERADLHRGKDNTDAAGGKVVGGGGNRVAGSSSAGRMRDVVSLRGRDFRRVHHLRIQRGGTRVGPFGVGATGARGAGGSYAVHGYQIRR